MESFNEENDKIDKTTIINSNEEPMTRSCAAIVTPGEASESDEEEEDINEEHSENSEEIRAQKQTIDSMNQSQESRISDDNSSVGDSIKYNTLLHKKLREKNEQLKKELSELACGPYNYATKEVANITKQLILSQKMVQNVSTTLRKVSKELFSLEESIDSIRNDKNILINDFIKNSNTTKETENEVQPNL